jgi:hypothetical protein
MKPFFNNIPFFGANWAGVPNEFWGIGEFSAKLSDPILAL